VKNYKIPTKYQIYFMDDYKKNLPNILTISRIVIIPIFIVSFYLDQNYKIMPAILFILASVTDFFDGYLSRKWGVTSKLGALLDPTADKMIVVTALVMLIHFNAAHLVPALLIMCREIFISGLREYLANKQIEVPVTKLAKWKTGTQMVALIVLLIDAGGVNKFFYYFGNTTLWIAAILTIYTGYAYFIAAIRSDVFSEDSPAFEAAPKDFDLSDIKIEEPTDDEIDKSFEQALKEASEKEAEKEMEK
jgi:cardiolipin synthase